MAPDEEDGTSDFTVSNLDEARFECTFGRGCDGVCCRKGRPPVSYDESLAIAHVLPRIEGALRPVARVSITRHSFLTKSAKDWPSLRVAGGWCVFFNKGCELHRLGLSEGDANRYKPASCAVFPLAQDRHGVWYVRQRGLEDENFDVFCLDPAVSSVPASLSQNRGSACSQARPRGSIFGEAAVCVVAGGLAFMQPLCGTPIPPSGDLPGYFTAALEP